MATPAVVTILASAGAAIAIAVAWTYHAREIRTLRRELDELKRPPTTTGRSSGKFVSKLYAERSTPFLVLGRYPGSTAVSAFALLVLVALTFASVGGSRGSNSSTTGPKVADLKATLDSIGARLLLLSGSVDTLRLQTEKASKPEPVPVRRVKQAQSSKPKLATNQPSAIAPAPPPPVLQP